MLLAYNVLRVYVVVEGNLGEAKGEAIYTLLYEVAVKYKE
jgi:hypothetical protein